MPVLTGRLDILRLPPELQVCIFGELPDLWSVIAFRLTCRRLNNTYLAHEEQINSSIARHIAAPFYDHYEFLTRLWVPKSSIVHPPPSGWPDIKHENYGRFLQTKTSFAFELLRHLPYIERTDTASTKEPDPNSDWDDDLTMIHSECSVINYSGFAPNTFHHGQKLELVYKRNEELPKHMVIIAWGMGGGVEIFLDTLLGNIHECQAVEPFDLITLDKVENYFAARRKACEDLDFVFVPHSFSRAAPNDEPYDAVETEAKGPPYQWGGNSHDILQWIRHLYRKSGWPGDGWNKEEAREAIASFIDILLH